MSDLGEIRAKIDALDTELLRLLNQRAELAREIGVIKNRDSLPIYSPARETSLLRGLIERSSGPLRAEAIQAIYREIMSASLALEKDVAIACLGPSGSQTHQAAIGKFGSSVRYTTLPDIASVFAEVASDQADCGVVPLDEPGHGLVSQTLDELAAREVSVCAEIRTNGSGEDRNAARYLVVGRTPNPPSGEDHTMLMLRIEDKPGALVDALGPFKELQINLSHFASRPAMKGSGDIFFYVEADGHTRDLQLSDLFRELSKKCRAVKVLGSYPKDLSALGVQ